MVQVAINGLTICALGHLLHRGRGVALEAVARRVGEGFWLLKVRFFVCFKIFSYICILVNSIIFARDIYI